MVQLRAPMRAPGPWAPTIADMPTPAILPTGATFAVQVPCSYVCVSVCSCMCLCARACVCGCVFECVRVCDLTEGGGVPPSHSRTHRLWCPQARGPNPDNLNSVGAVAFQFGPTDSCFDATTPPDACVFNSAALALLEQLVAEPAFNTLRTQEQLGYVVFAFQLGVPFWVPAGATPRAHGLAACHTGAHQQHSPPCAGAPPAGFTDVLQHLVVLVQGAPRGAMWSGGGSGVDPLWSLQDLSTMPPTSRSVSVHSWWTLGSGSPPSLMTPSSARPRPSLPTFGNGAVALCVFARVCVHVVSCGLRSRACARVCGGGDSPVSMAEDCAVWWDGVATRSRVFDRSARLADTIGNLTAPELVRKHARAHTHSLTTSLAPCLFVCLRARPLHSATWCPPPLPTMCAADRRSPWSTLGRGGTPAAPTPPCRPTPPSSPPSVPHWPTSSLNRCAFCLWSSTCLVRTHTHVYSRKTQHTRWYVHVDADWETHVHEVARNRCTRNYQGDRSCTRLSSIPVRQSQRSSPCRWFCTYKFARTICASKVRPLPIWYTHDAGEPRPNPSSRHGIAQQVAQLALLSSAEGWRKCVEGLIHIAIATKHAGAEGSHPRAGGWPSSCPFLLRKQTQLRPARRRPYRSRHRHRSPFQTLAQCPNRPRRGATAQLQPQLPPKPPATARRRRQARAR